MEAGIDPAAGLTGNVAAVTGGANGTGRKIARAHADFLPTVQAEWGAVDLPEVIGGVKPDAPATVARGAGHIITVASAASLQTSP